MDDYAEGKQDRGRSSSAGSRAHVDLDTTEARSVAGDRIYQRKECDTLGSCIRREEAEFVGQHFWARGYWVSTVGHNEAAVRLYIREQEKEDRRLDQLGLLLGLFAGQSRFERLQD